MFNALRRFINLKGLLKQIRNDCGKNFTRADEELGLDLCRWVYQQRINGFCTYRGIKWISNPRETCHMGGAWERMTKAVHQILKALLKRAVQSEGARNDRREGKCKLRQQFLNGQLWNLLIIVVLVFIFINIIFYIVLTIFSALILGKPSPSFKKLVIPSIAIILFRTTHCFVSIAVRLTAKCSRTEWLKCTILSPY